MTEDALGVLAVVTLSFFFFSCVFVLGLHAVLARSVTVRGSNVNLVVLLHFFLPAYVFVLGLHIVLAIVWP